MGHAGWAGSLRAVYNREAGNHRHVLETGHGGMTHGDDKHAWAQAGER